MAMPIREPQLREMLPPFAWGMSYAAGSPAILRVAHVLHPLDDLAVLLLLDGDVRHGGGGGGSVPVLFAGREPDHVAGMDLLRRGAFALRPAATGGHDERLA